MRKDRNYRSRQVYCWHFARPLLPICAVYISQKKKMGPHRSDCGSLLCDTGGIAIGGTRSSAETKRFGIKRKKNKQKQSKIRSIHYRRIQGHCQHSVPSTWTTLFFPSSDTTASAIRYLYAADTTET